MFQILAWRNFVAPVLFDPGHSVLVHGVGVRLLWVIALVASLQVDELLPVLATRGDLGTCPSDCDDDPQDRCPPLCPGCMCTHSVRAVALTPAAPAFASFRAPGDSRLAAQNRRMPESLSVDGVFHPPKV